MAKNLSNNNILWILYPPFLKLQNHFNFTFIGMKLKAVLLFMVVTSFLSCKKDQASEKCPVNYTLDNYTYSLTRKWDFVGFVDTTTDSIDPPLCGQVESYIKFTDTLVTTHTSPYYIYQYKMNGTALINHYSGSYTLTDSTHIQLSKTVNTTVTGTDDVQEFEKHFHDVLEQISTYKLNHNELTLIPASGTTVMRFKASL